jgi:hypothetical protein
VIHDDESPLLRELRMQARHIDAGGRIGIGSIRESSIGEIEIN